jgi:hypothetical protein
MRRILFLLAVAGLGAGAGAAEAQGLRSQPQVARPHVTALVGRAGVSGNQPLLAARFSLPLSPLALFAEVGSSGFKTLGCVTRGPQPSCRLTANPAFVGTGGLQLHTFQVGPVFPYLLAGGGLFAWTDKHAGNPSNTRGQPEDDPSTVDPLVVFAAGANVQIRRRFQGTIESGYRGIFRDGELGGGLQVLGGLRFRL